MSLGQVFYEKCTPEKNKKHINFLISFLAPLGGIFVYRLEMVPILSLSHPRASQKLLEVFVRLCASIDRKITKLYENPEKPPNPTEMFSIFFGIKRLGPRTYYLSPQFF